MIVRSSRSWEPTQTRRTFPNFQTIYPLPTHIEKVERIYDYEDASWTRNSASLGLELPTDIYFMLILIVRGLWEWENGCEPDKSLIKIHSLFFPFFAVQYIYEIEIGSLNLGIRGKFSNRVFKPRLEGERVKEQGRIEQGRIDQKKETKATIRSHIVGRNSLKHHNSMEKDPTGTFSSIGPRWN